jgi:hypothetical protein
LSSAVAAGLFYGNLWGSGAAPSGYGISGFSAATNMVTSINGVTPTNTLSNPYPTGPNPVTGSSLGAATLLGQSVSFYGRAQKTPYNIHWNFGVQQLFPHSAVLALTNVGTHSLHVPANLTLNPSCWDQSIGPYTFTGETISGGAIQDYNNLKAELSPSTIDQTHRLVFGTLYRLPPLAGRA